MDMLEHAAASQSSDGVTAIGEAMNWVEEMRAGVRADVSHFRIILRIG